MPADFQAPAAADLVRVGAAAGTRGTVLGDGIPNQVLLRLVPRSGVVQMPFRSSLQRSRSCFLQTQSST